MDTSTQPWNSTESKEKIRDNFEHGTEAVKKTTEAVSQKVPFLLFSVAALASIAISLFFQIRGNKNASLFVGQWVPSFLLFGLYNKISKTVGAD